MCIPQKKVHCYKLSFLINLSKTPRLNFPWKNSATILEIYWKASDP
jgi:hypothetical protein